MRQGLSHRARKLRLTDANRKPRPHASAEESSECRDVAKSAPAALELAKKRALNHQNRC